MTIEVWIDNGEAFFCEGGRISLHIKAGTVSKSAVKFGEYQTSSMQEAHKAFAGDLADRASRQVVDELLGNEEGWD